MDIIDNIKLAAKGFFYQTLTEENIEKIIKRKEKELAEIQNLKKVEIEKIKEEMYKELEGHYTNEEIDKMINDIISKA